MTPARLWLPVTVRVAWELLLARVRVRPAVLVEAREHVLRGLPTGASAEEAEDLCGILTRDYLGRVREARYTRPALDPDLGFSVPRTWRDRLNSALDPVSDAVLRMHYGDGLGMAEVERHAAIDGSLLEAAREGVREALRSIAAEDGQPLDDWADGRLDALIRRVATVASPNCPGPAGLLSEAGREHAGRCPRCSRAVRLIRQGVISPNDLFLPEGEPLVPAGRVDLLVLLLHPDGRKHRAALIRVLGDAAVEIGPDAWLLAREDVAALIPGLTALAEAGTPARHHLRGAAAEGPGRWTRGVVLGPLPVEALERARSRPWSEIDGVGELPTPLPPPPRATAWWAVAGLSAILAGGAGLLALRPLHPDPVYPVEAAFIRTATGWDLRFDTDDLATVSIVVQDDRGLVLEKDGLTAEKAQWATGEGDFQLAVPAPRAAVISSPGPLPDLPALIVAAKGAPEPMETLAKLVREKYPLADMAITPDEPPPAPKLIAAAAPAEPTQAPPPAPAEPAPVEEAQAAPAPPVEAPPVEAPSEPAPVAAAAPPVEAPSEPAPVAAAAPVHPPDRPAALAPAKRSASPAKAKKGTAHTRHTP